MNPKSLDCSDLIVPDCVRIAKLTQEISRREGLTRLDAVQGHDATSLIARVFARYRLLAILMPCRHSPWDFHGMRSDGRITHFPGAEATHSYLIFHLSRLRDSGLDPHVLAVLVNHVGEIGFLMNDGFVSAPATFYLSRNYG
jgi:hypothetical protein